MPPFRVDCHKLLCIYILDVIIHVHCWVFPYEGSDEGAVHVKLCFMPEKDSGPTSSWESTDTRFVTVSLDSVCVFKGLCFSF